MGWVQSSSRWCADGGEACGKDEKFLKDEPPARFLQSLKRRGKVHRLIGKVRGAKTIAGLHSLRQNVRKSIPGTRRALAGRTRR